MKRDGITTIAFVMILLVAISIAGTSIFLSRSAGRSTQWFLQAQRSQDLASTALKVVLSRLEELGADPRAPATGDIHNLVRDLRSTREASPRYVLLGPREAYPWSVELTEQLGLWGEGSPDVSVTARVFDAKALWMKDEIPGLKPDPRERRGVLQLTSSARTTGRDGRSVGRTLVLEREFRTVSVRPPLLGRFALFVSDAPQIDPNFCSVTLESTGDAKLSPGSPVPLVVRSSRHVELTSGQRLRRAVPATDALNTNGWIYLGNAEPSPGAQTHDWDLRLAHGYGRDGDTPLLPGRPTPGRAGFELLHGFARGDERIGADVAGSPPRAARPPEATQSSGLRLFGTPAEASPTLVFGPVQRVFRRAPVEPAASGAAIPEAVDDRDPYLTALEQLMLPGPAGSYRADGVLAEDPAAAPTAAAEVQCRVEPVRNWLAGARTALLPGSSAPFPGVPPEPFNGELRVPELYEGNLDRALGAFHDAMNRKAVYTVSAADARELLEREHAALPGVLAVKNLIAPGLVLGRMTFARGGILVVGGGVRLEGNVEREERAGPVTIVSLSGDIIIGRNASRVDAHLVATNGQVQWPFACRIQGGVAARRLDLEHLKEAPAERLIEYDGAGDPTTAREDEDYRVLFGGEDRLAVLGAEDS